MFMGISFFIITNFASSSLQTLRWVNHALSISSGVFLEQAKPNIGYAQVCLEGQSGKLE